MHELIEDFTRTKAWMRSHSFFLINEGDFCGLDKILDFKTFYFGDILNFFTKAEMESDDGIKSFTGDDYSKMRIPYPMTCIEYYIDLDGNENFPATRRKVALFCMDGKQLLEKENILIGTEFYAWVAMRDVNSNGKWILSPYSITISKRTGKSVFVGALETEMFNLIDESDLKSHRTIVDAQNLCLERVLEILSCRNIGFEDVDPPEKLNRKRKKRKKQPMVSYKTLVVDLGKKGSYNLINGGSMGSGVAFHKCRGHYRLYTESAPLFGKYTGRFFIPTHIRGDKKHGEVRKEYEIKKSGV